MAARAGAPVPCVGAIVRDAAGRLLLVQRGRDPERGRWSLPGGRVEPGETDEVALAREVLEETGLPVRVGDLIGRVLRPGLGGRTYAIADYACSVAGHDEPGTGTAEPVAGSPEPVAGSPEPVAGSPEPVAGDDAVDVRWCGPAELATLPLTGGLVEALTRWGVLPG